MEVEQPIVASLHLPDVTDLPVLNPVCKDWCHYIRMRPEQEAALREVWNSADDCGKQLLCKSWVFGKRGQNRVTYSFNGRNRICLKHVCTVVGCARRRIVKLVRTKGVILDGRGRHRNRTNKVSDAQRALILAWINQFEQIHGVRSNLTLIYESWIATRLSHSINSHSGKSLTRKWFERFYKEAVASGAGALKRRRSSIVGGTQEIVYETPTLSRNARRFDTDEYRMQKRPRLATFEDASSAESLSKSSSSETTMSDSSEFRLQPKQPRADTIPCVPTHTIGLSFSFPPHVVAASPTPHNFDLLSTLAMVAEREADPEVAPAASSPVPVVAPSPASLSLLRKNSQQAPLPAPSFSSPPSPPSSPSTGLTCGATANATTVSIPVSAFLPNLS